MVETPKGLVKNEVFSSVAISSDKVGVKTAANKANKTENCLRYISNHTRQSTKSKKYVL